MENEVSSNQIAMRYGLILSILYVILTAATLIATGTDPVGMAWVQLLVGWVLSPGLFILIVILAQNKFLKDGNGYMSFGKAMGIMVIILLVALVISNLYSYVHMTVIDPGYMQTAQEAQLNQLRENGMSEEEIELATNNPIAKAFSNPVLILAVSFVVSFIVLFIIGLIISAVKKKSEPSF